MYGSQGVVFNFRIEEKKDFFSFFLPVLDSLIELVETGRMFATIRDTQQLLSSFHTQSLALGDSGEAFDLQVK
jgi:hypothetical protein